MSIESNFRTFLNGVPKVSEPAAGSLDALAAVLAKKADALAAGGASLPELKAAVLGEAKRAGFDAKSFEHMAKLFTITARAVPLMPAADRIGDAAQYRRFADVFRELATELVAARPSTTTPTSSPEARAPAGKPIDPGWRAVTFVIAGLKTAATTALADGSAKKLAGEPADLSEHHRFEVSKTDAATTFGYFSTLESARSLYIAKVPHDGSPIAWSESST